MWNFLIQVVYVAFCLTYHVVNLWGAACVKTPFSSSLIPLVMRKITQTRVLATLRLLLTRHFPWELWTLDLMNLPRSLFTVEHSANHTCLDVFWRASIIVICVQRNEFCSWLGFCLWISVNSSWLLSCVCRFTRLGKWLKLWREFFLSGFVCLFFFPFCSPVIQIWSCWAGKLQYCRAV